MLITMFFFYPDDYLSHLPIHFFESLTQKYTLVYTYQLKPLVLLNARNHFSREKYRKVNVLEHSDGSGVEVLVLLEYIYFSVYGNK